MPDHAPSQKTQKQPKKITPTYLENAALYYLNRYAASTASLRKVLMRRVDRSCDFHKTDKNEAIGWVEDLIKRYERSGLLDDRLYAEAKITSLHRRGDSVRMIKAKLGHKGISPDLIDEITAALSTTSQELEAALSLCRRRRLGPFRDKNERNERYQKDLAALARAGFSYDIAKRALDDTCTR